MDHKIILKTIVGSQAYGTSTPTSDVDVKGIYIQENDDILSFKYKEQINITKDETYYEIRRFLELAKSSNPTILELMYIPEECILEKSPAFDLIVENRDKFLTKKCLQSFGGYAITQIKKAKGLDKKMNWEKTRVERKDPLDFCYIYLNGKSYPLKKYLSDHKIDQSTCGLVGIDHFHNTYALYLDECDTDNFNGIVLPDSNEVRVSSIPKGRTPISVITFNKESYSTHCKDFKEYQIWLENRNESRYVDITNHDQKIDGKNLLHCRRLIDMAMEIATDGKISVKRPNADYLLQIRRGEIQLDEIIEEAEQDIKRLDYLYDRCDLPDEVDPDFVNELLLKIRKFK